MPRIPTITILLAEHCKIFGFNRSEAYKKGFLHVHSNQLKWTEESQNGILLPSEVTFLFQRYIDQFCKEKLSHICHTDKQKMMWLLTFIANNPLSEPLLKYAYGEIPAEYLSLREEYQNLYSLIKEFHLGKTNQDVDHCFKPAWALLNRLQQQTTQDLENRTYP